MNPLVRFVRARTGLPTSLRLLVFLWSFSFGPHPAAGAAVEPLPTLTQAEQIRQLTPEQAALGYPVRVRGVVIDYNPKISGDLVIQDATAGIYVAGTHEMHHVLRPGQVVEVMGTSGAGDFAPVIVASQLEVIGEGELPVPREVAYERLATGAEDGQWVKVRGVIRAAAIEHHQTYDRLVFELATGGGRLTVRVPDFDPDVVDRMVDAEVCITGSCFPVFNRKRQLLNIKLSVPGMQFVQITKPAPENHDAIPTRKINSLLKYAPREPSGHRVKVSGIVTLQLPGQALFLKDETQGLWVKTRQTTTVAPGDRVEVIGFPAVGEYTPVLEDAVFRKTGVGRAAEATLTTADAVRDGDYDADLVRIDAQLLNIVEGTDELVLVLEENDFIFRAHLSHARSAALPKSLVTGCRVELTGVCQSQLQNQRWPQSFRLFLRSPADIQVVRQPPWWTLPRVLWALSGVTLVLLLAMAWVVTLGRRVRQQTGIIRQQAQREAVLEERTRLAREFHDTLEQKLSGIGLQIETAADKLSGSPDAAQRCLDTAHSMVRYAQAEARRSVWDLRSGTLEKGDLAEALRQSATQLRNGSDTAIAVNVRGDSRRLPSPLENHLLRIGQEAMANALRHGRARAVEIDLEYRTDDVLLRIHDDGCGFDVATCASRDEGHFGLLGMHERAEKMGGTLRVTSQPGAGTTIEAMVPTTANIAEPLASV